MYLSSEHFIQIAAGNVKKTSHINKFGYNSAVGTAFETVHDGSNVYSYIANAGTATVAGASDAGAVVEIQGLDANYNLTILTGNGQTLMCVYTIPAGKTGYLIKFQGSVEKQKECEFRILTRDYDNGGFNIKGQFGSFGTTVTYDYPVPLKIETKTDLEIRSKAGATTGMGAVFDIILIDR